MKGASLVAQGGVGKWASSIPDNSSWEQITEAAEMKLQCPSHASEVQVFLARSLSRMRGGCQHLKHLNHFHGQFSVHSCFAIFFQKFVLI